MKLSTLIAYSILVVIFIVFVYVAMSNERKETDTFAQKLKYIFHKRIIPIFMFIALILGAVQFAQILEHFNFESGVIRIYGPLFWGVSLYSLYYISKNEE